MNPNSKPDIFGYIYGTVVLWLLSIYVFLTGDPTHLLTTGKIYYVQRDPFEVGLDFFGMGTVVLCIGLWKRYGRRK